MSTVETRLERLNTVSARQLREPEAEFPWNELGKGQVLPDELLSVNGLDVALTAEQRATLAREEVASMLAAGIHFEAVLDAAFSLRLAYSRELDDPRHVYMLHEVGEETRHQRAFLRLREQLAPRAKNPFDHAAIAFVMRRMINIVLRSRALFCTLLLAGEEIPDYVQKLASEHPETDPVLKAVNRYHRAEEARHLAFARMIMPEEWAKANALDRFRVRFSAPVMIRALFDGMVHPRRVCHRWVAPVPDVESRAPNAAAARRPFRGDPARAVDVAREQGVARRPRSSRLAIVVRCRQVGLAD